MTSMKLKIQNAKGLHARASAKFVETVESFEAECEVSKDDLKVTGDSIMGLLMLGAAKGDEIFIEITGPDAEKLSLALDDLINDKFGESE